jgi:hypothetical protein
MLPESVRSATEKRSGYKYGQEVDGVAKGSSTSGTMIRLRSNISASQVTSRASFLFMLVRRRQVLLQSAVAIVLSQCPWLAACPAANSLRWSPLAELQEAALGSATTRPWSTRSHAEMRETSPLTTIAYRGCRHAAASICRAPPRTTSSSNERPASPSLEESVS